MRGNRAGEVRHDRKEHRMRAALLILSAALAAAPFAAAAQTVVPVARFTGVELHGGGSLSIHQGPLQRVTLVQGDPTVASFEVNSRGRLIVSSCKGICMGSQHLAVEIETP